MIVAVEDNIHMLQRIKEVLFNFNIEYKTFSDFTESFFKLIKTSEAKIYILDLELPSGSGIDVARTIRETDHISKIIIMSAHPEAIPYLLQERLEVYTFIYKGDNGFDKLKNAVSECIEILYNKEEILSVEKIKHSKYCLVKTASREYQVRASLKEMKEKYGLRQVNKSRLER